MVRRGEVRDGALLHAGMAHRLELGLRCVVAVDRRIDPQVAASAASLEFATVEATELRHRDSWKAHVREEEEVAHVFREKRGLAAATAGLDVLGRGRDLAFVATHRLANEVNDPNKGADQDGNNRSDDGLRTVVGGCGMGVKLGELYTWGAGGDSESLLPPCVWSVQTNAEDTESYKRQ